MRCGEGTLIGEGAVSLEGHHLLHRSLPLCISLFDLVFLFLKIICVRLVLETCVVLEHLSTPDALYATTTTTTERNNMTRPTNGSRHTPEGNRCADR